MEFNLNADTNNLLYCLYMEEQERKKDNRETNVKDTGFWWEHKPPKSEK